MNTMTNAIEQTRREMYEWLGSAKRLADSKASAQAMEMLEICLEEHLECLRKDREFCESVVALSEAKAAKAKEECDTLRNRIQAFEMASQTSAEIIKGLRAELDKASFGVNCTILPRTEQASRSAKAADLLDIVAQAKVEPQNASIAKTDPYTLGYGSLGKCSNPFPINTIERLHWNDGARDRMSALGQRS